MKLLFGLLLLLLYTHKGRDVFKMSSDKEKISELEKKMASLEKDSHKTNKLLQQLVDDVGKLASRPVPPTAGPSRTPDPPDPLATGDVANAADLNKRLIMGITLLANGQGERGQKVMNLLGPITGAGVDQLVPQQQKQCDDDYYHEYGIPHLHGPPCSFGQGKLSKEDQKHINVKISQIRQAKSTAKAEDVFRLIRRLHEENNNCFSEQELGRIIHDLLPEKADTAFENRMRQNGSLTQAWIDIYRQYRKRRTPTEALGHLNELQEDMTMDPEELMLEIKSTAEEAATEGNDANHQALFHAEAYFKAFLDPFKIEQLSKGGTTKADKWANLVSNVKQLKKAIIETRDEKIFNKKPTASVKQVGAQVQDTKDANAETQRQVQKLATSVGQMQHQIKTMAAAGQSMGLPQQSGYYMASKAFPPQHQANRSVMDPVFFGKCLLCLDANHRWQQCPHYPGMKPMTNMCFCYGGAHPYSICKHREAWKPANERSPMPKTGFERTTRPPGYQQPPRGPPLPPPQAPALHGPGGPAPGGGTTYGPPQHQFQK